MAVERVLSNLNLISFKTEGGLQNHIDELQDGDLVFTPDNSLKGNLFDFKWTDHKLNDISWLNADTFSWQSGDVYVAAFEHLVSDLFQKAYAWQYQPAQGGQVGYTKSETPEVGQYLYTDGNKNLITEVGSGYLVVQNYKTGDSQRFERIDADIESTNMFAEHETETIDDITITFYRAEDGHKICLADQEANVQRLYDWMGVAWYYVFDIINKRFKLPRTKYAFTGLRDSVGGYVKAGLPNITGEAGYYLANVGSLGVNIANGAFAKTGSEKLPTATKTGTESKAVNTRFNFNASRSSSVYGNSNTVQPEATQMYLYFYVGNFEREAIEQTAGLSAELFNGKADTSSVQALESRTDALEEHDYVVASQKPTSANGYTWYRKYKSGWVEMGGQKNTDTGQVNFPVVMANTYYQVQVTGGDDNYGINYIARNRTTTAVWITARTSSGSDYNNWFGYWQVCGMAAQ